MINLIKKYFFNKKMNKLNKEYKKLIQNQCYVLGYADLLTKNPGVSIFGGVDLKIMLNTTRLYLTKISFKEENKEITGTILANNFVYFPNDIFDESKIHQLVLNFVNEYGSNSTISFTNVKIVSKELETSIDTLITPMILKFKAEKVSYINRIN